MKYSWQLHDTFAKGARAGLIAYSLARCTHPRSSSTACFLDNGRVGAFITRAIWHVPAAYGARPQGDLQVVGPPRPVSVRRGTRPGSPRPPQRARRATQASPLCGCNGMRMAGIAVRGCSGQHHISQIEHEGQTTHKSAGRHAQQCVWHAGLCSTCVRGRRLAEQHAERRGSFKNQSSKNICTHAWCKG
jgi:hypothetical protein